MQSAVSADIVAVSASKAAGKQVDGATAELDSGQNQSRSLGLHATQTRGCTAADTILCGQAELPPGKETGAAATMPTLAKQAQLLTVSCASRLSC